MALTFLFEWLGWIHWRALWALTPDAAYLAPALNVPLFCLLGLILSMGGRLFSVFRRLRGAVFLFGFLLAFDLLVFSGHIRGSALPSATFTGFFLAIAVIAIAFAGSHFVGNKASTSLRFVRVSLKWTLLGNAVLALGVPGWLLLQEDLATSRLPVPPDGAPNVLLVVVDTLRADHLSAYGYPRNTSPHLDQLAQRGVLFEKAIATSSWTLPSFASMVTGLYPSDHGAETRRLDGRHATVAEVFQSLGYRTGAFSANPFFFCPRMGFGRGFLRFSEISHSPSEWLNRTALGRYLLPWFGRVGVKLPPPRRDAVDVNHSFLHWLDARPGRTFFAMLNYFDVHDPYFPPNPYRQMFSTASSSNKVKEEWVRNQVPIRTPSGVRTWVDAYDGSIRFLDDQIADLLTELEKRGMGANTLVVMAGDHGESFGEHGLVQHNNALYMDTIHVPLIFFWPGKVPQSIRVKQPVSLASIPATLLDLCGQRSHSAFEAASLKPLFEPGGPTSWPSPRSEMAQLPYSFSNPGDPILYGRMTSIVRERWHYILHEHTGEELYDWSSDPEETKDLSHTPEAQEVLAEFRKQLRSR